jgi:hypothetical protein
MSFQEQLEKNLSPGDFARMTEWLSGIEPGDRIAMMQFIAARETAAPNVGDEAPDFELPLRGTNERVHLSYYRDKRPVALIFGSYT